MTVRNSILIECHEDYVGLWSILKSIRFNSQQKLNASESRRETMKLIEELLKEGLIEPGMFANNGNFEIWQLSTTDIIAKIEAEWDALGRDPTIADIVWFITTEKGDREVKLLLDNTIFLKM